MAPTVIIMLTQNREEVGIFLSDISIDTILVMFTNKLNIIIYIATCNIVIFLPQ